MLERLGEQGLAGGEVVVDERGRDPRVHRDAGDPHRVDPVARDPLDRRVEDPLARGPVGHRVRYASATSWSKAWTVCSVSV